MPQDHEVLEVVRERVARYEREFAQAMERFKIAQKAINEAAERLKVARAFFQQETQHIGVPATTNGKARFAGKRLHEAILQVLSERNRATLKGIVDTLKAGGFDFNGKSPGRSVFLTLTNLANARNARVRRYGKEYAAEPAKKQEGDS